MRSRYASRDGSLAAGRAGRHVHAPLQHGPDRGDAGLLPRQAPGRTAAAGRSRVDARPPAATFYAGRARAVAGLRHPLGPARPPPGHALRAGLRRHRGRPDRAHRRTSSLLGGTRLLEGASTAASVPVDPRLHRHRDGRQRGPPRARPSARFEGATLAGIGVGLSSSRRSLFETCDRADGLLPQRRIYGVSFLIYRSASTIRPARRRHGGRARPDCGRYVALIRSSHVWLLAPTWIAINAASACG